MFPGRLESTTLPRSSCDTFRDVTYIFEDLLETNTGEAGANKTRTLEDEDEEPLNEEEHEETLDEEERREENEAHEVGNIANEAIVYDLVRIRLDGQQTRHGRKQDRHGREQKRDRHSREQEQDRSDRQQARTDRERQSDL